MFGLFGKKKEKYPLMTSEMIQPTDMLITTTEAKRIFKYFMKEIGYLEKDQLSEYANDLGDAIRDETDMHRDTVSEQKEFIAEQKKKLKEIKNSLKQCKDNSKEEIESEFQDQIDFIADLTSDLDLAAKEFADFKTDKRSFLIEYVNGQIERN